MDGDDSQTCRRFNMTVDVLMFKHLRIDTVYVRMHHVIYVLILTHKYKYVSQFKIFIKECYRRGPSSVTSIPCGIYVNEVTLI
jgi:hypothetical protein